MKKKIFIYIKLLKLSFFLSVFNCSAQWYQANGTINGEVTCFTVNGNTVFAGTNISIGGIYVSYDNGANWTSVKSGIDVLSLAAKDTFVFAGTDGDGIYRSTDSGATWESINSTLGANKSIKALTIGGFGGSYIFAGDWEGVYRSSKSDISWSFFSDGLPLSPSVNTLVSTSSTVFAGSEAGLFSAPTSGSWTPKNDGLTSSSINILVIKGSSIYAGTSEGIFRSTNNGSNWGAMNIGLPQYNISAIVVNGNNIFAGNGTDVYLSVNNGISWARTNPGLTGLSENDGITTLAICGSNVIAGTESSGIWIRPLSEMVNIEEIIDNSGFLVYPNPVIDKLNIEILNSMFKQGHYKFEILNAIGQTVYGYEIEKQAVVDIAHLNSGFYLIKLNTENTSFFQKFVKQ